MKILHIINDLSSGGAESLLRDLVPLQNINDSVTVLTLSNKKSVFDKYLINLGVNVINTTISNNIYNPLHIFEIRKIISEYDIIHAHLFPTFYFVAISNLFRKDKKILITTEHSTYNKRRNKKIFYFLDSFIYGVYDSVISISKGVENELLNWLKIDFAREKYTIINNGIDKQKFTNALPYQKRIIDENCNIDDVILLMVARFNKQKDHLTVLRALKELPENYRLWLVGEGEMFAQIKDWISQFQLEKRVKFLGFREDIPNIIKTADICLLSSESEGFGLAAVEAMASGVPLIVSDVIGLREVVGDGALLFDKGDYYKLSELIKLLATNRDKYFEIASKGIKRAEKFSIVCMNEKYTELYQRLWRKHND